MFVERWITINSTQLQHQCFRKVHALFTQKAANSIHKNFISCPLFWIFTQVCIFACLWKQKVKFARMSFFLFWLFTPAGPPPKQLNLTFLIIFFSIKTLKKSERVYFCGNISQCQSVRRPSAFFPVLSYDFLAVVISRVVLSSRMGWCSAHF